MSDKGLFKRFLVFLGLASVSPPEPPSPSQKIQEAMNNQKNFMSVSTGAGDNLAMEVDEIVLEPQCVFENCVNGRAVVVDEVLNTRVVFHYADDPVMTEELDIGVFLKVYKKSTK